MIKLLSAPGVFAQRYLQVWPAVILTRHAAEGIEPLRLAAPRAKLNGKEVARGFPSPAAAVYQRRSASLAPAASCAGLEHAAWAARPALVGRRAAARLLPRRRQRRLQGLPVGGSATRSLSHSGSPLAASKRNSCASSTACHLSQRRFFLSSQRGACLPSQLITVSPETQNAPPAKALLLKRQAGEGLPALFQFGGKLRLYSVEELGQGGGVQLLAAAPPNR